MKTILLILALTLTSFVSVNNFETEYCKGYKNGYTAGYCYGKGDNCVKPVTPICPTPQLNEKSSSYSDGYNRGFTDGRKKK
jgi:hypothetical protein